MNEFTPGPWKAIGREIYHPGMDLSLAHCFMDSTGLDTAEANARLMAAAPMLYEALINADYAVWYMANNGLEDMIDWEERFNQLTEAIALVKGE